MWQQMPTDGSCRSGEGHRITSNPVNRVICRACHLVKITANYPSAPHLPPSPPDRFRNLRGQMFAAGATMLPRTSAPFFELFSSVAHRACRRTACNFIQQRVNSATNGCMGRTVLPTFYCHFFALLLSDCMNLFCEISYRSLRDTRAVNCWDMVQFFIYVSLSIEGKINSKLFLKSKSRLVKFRIFYVFYN